MCNLYRGPSKDSSYQISIHLDKWFQRRSFFRNQPIRNKNCLKRPCLVTDLDEMRNHDKGPAIDASYQVSVHVAKRFQRRRFFGFLLDFRTVQILWYFVGFLLDFGTVQILWYFVDFLLDFRIVQTLLYFVGFLLVLELFRHCGIILVFY